MKSVIVRVLMNGFTGLAQGAKRLGLYAAAAGLLVVMSSATTAKAEGISQLETIQWLVQVSGDSGQFAANSTAADYIQWARVKGMNPTGGWQPSSEITRDALAQILVQYLGINPKKLGADFLRILEREGIVIPTGDITRSALVGVLDDYGVTGRLVTLAGNSGSPNRKGNNGRGNGEDPPPPGWTNNPRNPHFGVDLPGR
jgi:hypothetical protein